MWELKYLTSIRLQERVTMMAICLALMEQDEIPGSIDPMSDRPNAFVAITHKLRSTIMRPGGIYAKNLGWTCPILLVDIKLIVPNSSAFG